MKFISTHKLLLITGILAIFSLSPYGQNLLLLVMPSAIGTTLALILKFSMSAFIIVLMAHLVSYIFTIKLHFGIIIALLSLGVLAFALNMNLDSKVKQLTANDVNNLHPPIAFKTFAFIRDDIYTSSPACDDFCIRALLNGQVEKFILASSPTLFLSTDRNNINAVAYWLETRDKCPAITAKDTLNNLGLNHKDAKLKSPHFDDVKPRDVLNIHLANGHCLISAETNLADVDSLLLYGRAAHSQSVVAAGLNPLTAAVKANRLAFYQRENGELTLTFQKTKASAMHFAPLLLPYLVESDNGLTPAFMRTTPPTNLRSDADLDIPFTAFLEDELGLDLVMKKLQIEDRPWHVILTSLHKSGDLNPSELAEIESNFSSIGWSDDISAIHAEIYLKIFNDLRIPITYVASNVMVNEIHNNSKLVNDFAKTLFKRLADFKIKEQLDDNEEMQNISIALYHLPFKAIKPYYQQLKILAKNQDQNFYAAAILSRLSDFGDEAIPILLGLVDGANHPIRDDWFDIKEWRAVYGAGMSGLCNIAQNGSAHPALLDEIYQRMAVNNVVVFDEYWQKTIHLLLALGAKPDEIWQRLQKLDDEHSFVEFNAELENAQDELACSWY